MSTIKQKLAKTKQHIAYLEEMIALKKEEFALLKAIKNAANILHKNKQGKEEKQKLKELEDIIKNI